MYAPTVPKAGERPGWPVHVGACPHGCFAGVMALRGWTSREHRAPRWLLSPGLVPCFGSGGQVGGGAGARGGSRLARMVSSGLCVHGEPEMPLEPGDGL